jgi:hypothetical protein
VHDRAPLAQEAGTPNFRLGEDPRVRTTRRTPTVTSGQTTQPVATAVSRPDTSDHREIRGWPGLPPTRDPVQYLGTQRSPAATPRRCPCSRALIHAPATRSNSASPIGEQIVQRTHVQTWSPSPESSQSELNPRLRHPALGAHHQHGTGRTDPKACPLTKVRSELRRPSTNQQRFRLVHVTQSAAGKRTWEMSPATAQFGRATGSSPLVPTASASRRRATHTFAHYL